MKASVKAGRIRKGISDTTKLVNLLVEVESKRQHEMTSKEFVDSLTKPQRRALVELLRQFHKAGQVKLR